MPRPATRSACPPGPLRYPLRTVEPLPHPSPSPAASASPAGGAPCAPASANAATPAPAPVARRLQAIGHLVGNTPLLEIAFQFRGRTRRIFAKAEHLNMTGSIKDRMALHILRRAYADGCLVPGERIVEATSGNTGISFAAIGARARPPGDDLHARLDEPRAGRTDPQPRRLDPPGDARGRGLPRQHPDDRGTGAGRGCFLPRQFANPHNSEAHETGTAPEIWWQLAPTA